MKLSSAFLVICFLFLLNASLSSPRSARTEFQFASLSSPPDHIAHSTVHLDSLDHALEKAVWRGDVRAVRRLLDLGVDVNRISPTDGYTALHWAIERNMKAMAQLLIEHGADVNAMTHNAVGKERSALHIAAEMGHPDLVRLLLDHGADVHLKNEYGEAPLYGVRLFVTNTEVIKALIDHGADVNAATIFGSTPLHAAALQGSAEVAHLLVAHGAKVNQKNRRGLTPLHLAAEQGFEPVILSLTEADVELDAQTPNGDTALHLAARKGHSHIVRLLLSRGANPASLNNSSKSPLTEAWERSYDDVIELLSKATRVEES